MKKFYFQGPHFTPFIAGSGPPCIFFGCFSRWLGLIGWIFQEARQRGGGHGGQIFITLRLGVSHECLWGLGCKGGGCFTQTTTTTTTTRTTYPNINHIYLCFIYEYTTCVFAGFLIFLGLACFGQHLSLPLGQKLTATRRSERNDLRLWAAWPKFSLKWQMWKNDSHRSMIIRGKGWCGFIKSGQPASSKAKTIPFPWRINVTGIFTYTFTMNYKHQPFM